MTRALVAAFAFLTRLPVWVGPLDDRDLGRSVGFFPLVGLVLGLVTSGLSYALTGFLPSLLSGVAVVATLAAVTGGLHLDGLADLFDGLAGGRGDRQRTLAIMRDSHIGAQGAVAVVLLLIGKVAAVSTLLEVRDYLGLLAFPVVARWAVTLQIVCFPYAREEGLGRAFNGEAGPRELIIASATMLAVSVALGFPTARAAGAAFAVSLLLGFWLRARLGGLTGDVYGATVELAETVALYTATLR